MIQIQHLTITHNKDLRELVHDLNLTIATGEKVAIIGEEGNGKSSLLTLLVNPKAHFDHLLTRELLINQIAHRSIFPSRFRMTYNP